ncbi:hypothetical protein PH242_03430 [Photorhabdus bodei]|uniref:phage protein n=1 Tax=Photorhabdus bodei TaxID=2029681 RepID=UPI00232B6E87|nr:hypothetical protein [Photorhabdus bodei]MDB6366760.1 hypothetical protein [Photorhabdus bodei]
MSNELFGRDYKLTVKSVDDVELICAPPMQIKFSVTNMPQNQVASALITIYGVSEKYRQLIQKYDNKKARYGTVVLSAGYINNSGMIFNGQINSVEVARDGVNVYVRLYCWSVKWNEAVIGKTWGSNTPAKEVLKDVASTFENPVEFIGDFSDLPVFSHGLTLPYTRSRDFLNQMKATWEYEILISHARTVLIRKGASSNVMHEISSKNGMEGFPRWYRKDLEIDVKLDHRIQPADTIKITSEFWTINYSGMYQTGLQDMANTQRRTGKFNVLATSHQGDFWKDTWKTTITCLWNNQ